MQIFVSYRRDDSGVAARLVHNELTARHGAASVFMDIDDIGYGDDFAAVIDRELARADVVVVLIGPRWHRLIDERRRGDDWVRHEVAQALRLAGTGAPRRIVPVLLDGTAWPGPPLPEDIAPLQRLSAVWLRQAQLRADLTELLQAVQGFSFEQRGDELAQRLSGRRRARLAGAAVGLGLFFAAWLSLFDLLTLDTRLTAWTVAWAGPPPADDGRAVLVAIDAKTVAAVGRPFDASWRREHALVVEQAASAGARTLAFDVVMAEPAPVAADDAALAQAIGAVRDRLPVIVGFQGARREAGPGARPALAPALQGLAAAGLACAGKRLGQVALLPLAVQPAASAVPPRWPALALAAYSGGGAVEAIEPGAQQVQARLPAEQRSPRFDYLADETVVTPQAECPALAPGDRVASQWVDAARVRAAGVPRVAYEAVRAGEPAALRALAGKVAVVGVLLDGEDQFGVAGSGGRVAFGSELIVAQVAGLAAGRAVRGVGAVGLWTLMTALALGGGAVQLALRRHAAAWRRLGWAATLLLVGAAVLGWFRLEGQLVPLHYPLAACLLGGWLAARAVPPPASPAIGALA